jgi:hypothetical protein
VPSGEPAPQASRRQRDIARADITTAPAVRVLVVLVPVAVVVAPPPHLVVAVPVVPSVHTAVPAPHDAAATHSTGTGAIQQRGNTNTNTNTKYTCDGDGSVVQRPLVLDPVNQNRMFIVKIFELDTRAFYYHGD